MKVVCRKGKRVAVMASNWMRDDSSDYSVFDVSQDLDGDNSFAICVEGRHAEFPDQLIVVEYLGRQQFGDTDEQKLHPLWRIIDE